MQMTLGNWNYLDSIRISCDVFLHNLQLFQLAGQWQRRLTTRKNNSKEWRNCVSFSDFFVRICLFILILKICLLFHIFKIIQVVGQWRRRLTTSLWSQAHNLACSSAKWQDWWWWSWFLYTSCWFTCLSVDNGGNNIRDESDDSGAMISRTKDIINIYESDYEEEKRDNDKGRVRLPNRMNFRENSKRPSIPPSFSENYIAIL